MSGLELFWVFFKIGLFSIGGGYAILPMMSEQVVNTYHWLSTQEFTDIITISQMTPGPLAVNTSTFVGMRVAGITGAVCATTGCVCMGVMIALGIYHIFQRFSSSQIVLEVLKGLKAASLGLIMAAATMMVSLAFFKNGDMKVGNIEAPAVLIFSIILLISRKWKLNPIVLMVVSGLLGIFIYPW